MVAESFPRWTPLRGLEAPNAEVSTKAGQVQPQGGVPPPAVREPPREANSRERVPYRVRTRRRRRPSRSTVAKVASYSLEPICEGLKVGRDAARVVPLVPVSILQGTLAVPRG